jgi:hypothetical protein
MDASLLIAIFNLIARTGVVPAQIGTLEPLVAKLAPTLSALLADDNARQLVVTLLADIGQHLLTPSAPPAA